MYVCMFECDVNFLIYSLFYGKDQATRSSKESNFRQTTRIQLMGLGLRGQGMFSHRNLPIRAETIEYAWLLELTIGQLSGQLTISDLAILVGSVQEFIFGAMDYENQLVSSRDYELCQHGHPQVKCFVFVLIIIFQILILVI